MTETWKPVTVPEFEDLYEVSNLGRVRSLPRPTPRGVRGGQILKRREYVLISGKGLRKTVAVRELVRAAFEGVEPQPRRNAPQPGACNGRAKLDDRKVLEIRRRYAEGGKSQRALAAEFGINQPQVSRIVSGKRWRHLAEVR